MSEENTKAGPFLLFSPPNALSFDSEVNVSGHETDVASRARGSLLTSSASLKLQNLTDSVIAFKVSSTQVKTTVPMAYKVKPNLGLIIPGHALTITITKQCSAEQQSFKHKFLVMSCITGLSVTASSAEVNQFIESCPAHSVQQTKLDVDTVNVSVDSQPSMYEEATDQSMSASTEPLSSFTAGLRTKKKSRLISKTVQDRQRSTAEERTEIEREICRLKDEETARLQESQVMSSIFKAQKRSRVVPLYQALLSLLAGLVLGFLFLRPS
jgi:hypothetical protein